MPSQHDSSARVFSAPLYFVHIPKTAGTSLVALLDTAFAAQEIAPPRRWEEFGKLDSNTIDAYKLWRGHFGAHGLDTLLSAVPIRITMLRDPLALAYSRYRYIRRDPATRLHAELTGRNLRFLDFLTWPRAQPLLCNPQCRSLSFALRPDLSRAQLLTLLLGPDPDAAVKAQALQFSAEEQFERAQACLAQMPWFGLTERFAESAATLAHWLGVACKPSHLMDGGDHDPSQLDQRARELVAAQAPWDQRLYDFAAQRFANCVLYCR